MLTGIDSDKPIALALSGGGIRAMVFHLGVLRSMAERTLLERVQRISTVSGGSLVTGLVLQRNGLRWPTSEQFLTEVLPALREQLCARSLQWGAARQLRDPRNWQYVLSRANLLGVALRNEWHVTGCLKDLPEIPEWSINGTTAENGKRFRFKASDMGDYALGYTSGVGSFPLAQAIAVSAAFPGGFGPLVIDPAQFTWMKRDWDADPTSAREVKLPFTRLHLYDGGVYDNLGLEPFFDAGRGRSKVGDVSIVVSDAGAPLSPGFSFGPLSVFRLKRMADIMSEQSRSVRVRTFASYVRALPGRGQLIYIGTPGRTQTEVESATFAKGFPTTLRRLRPAEFDCIASHGYQLAQRPEAVVEF